MNIEIIDLKAPTSKIERLEKIMDNKFMPLESLWTSLL